MVLDTRHLHCYLAAIHLHAVLYFINFYSVLRYRLCIEIRRRCFKNVDIIGKIQLSFDEVTSKIFMLPFQEGEAYCFAHVDWWISHIICNL